MSATNRAEISRSRRVSEPGRSVGRLICLAGLIGSLTVSGCKKPEPAAAAPPKEEGSKGRIQVPLPVDRKLVDDQGRELDARIIGKNRTHLTVIRKNDGARFDIEIAKLSVADQDYVLGLLDQRPSSPPPKPKGGPSAEEIRAEALRNEMNRIDTKIDEISVMMQDPALNARASPRRRGLETERTKLESRRMEIQLELRALERRSR